MINNFSIAPKGKQKNRHSYPEGLPAQGFRGCLIIHYEGHPSTTLRAGFGAQRFKKIRGNLCESVQSVAKSCPSEHVNRVSTKFQNALLTKSRAKDLYTDFANRTDCEEFRQLTEDTVLSA